MDRMHRGALSEFIDIQYLLERGYDVFRNVSQHGMADIVAIDFSVGHIFPIDVKTAHHSDNGIELPKRKLTPEQVQSGVSLMQVTHFGGVSWDHALAKIATT